MNLEEDLYFANEIVRNLKPPVFSVAGKEFEDCTFDHCDFSGGKFYKCMFDACKFENCNLSNLQINECVFRNVVFSKSKLIGIWWHEVRKRSGPMIISFEDCILNYSSFFGLDLRKCHFIRCNAVETDFSEANLSKVEFTQMNLAGATFIGCILNETDFSTATNYFFNPAENKIKGALFSMPEAMTLLQAMGIKLC